MELDGKVGFFYSIFGSGCRRTSQHFQLTLRAHLIYLLTT